MKRNSATWMGFLVMAFAVVGLVGAFSTYAAQVPFERALARSQALEEAVAASKQPDAAQRLEGLREALGDSFDRVMTGPGDMASRAAAERTRMLGELGQEAEGIGTRLRVVIVVFAAGAALFGAAVLGIVARDT